MAKQKRDFKKNKKDTPGRKITAAEGSVSHSLKKKKAKPARWVKGHSCESNPTVRKFRDGHSSGGFPLHYRGENALLTQNMLQTKNNEDMEEDFDVLSDDVRSLTVSDARSLYSLRSGSAASLRTFASGWSKCSNQAFERFLGRFKTDSAIHKEMLSILAATTEVINSFGGKHSDTEYFATFMSVLEKCEPSQHHPVMALLCIIIGKVPEAVIKKRFREIYPKIGNIFTSAIENGDYTLIRLCCNALGKMLKTQDFVVTDSEDGLAAYYSILKCCLSDNPKVRRKARQVIGGLLNKENGKESNMFRLVFGWILDQLEAYPTCGTKVAADTLGLLQFIWNFVTEITDTAAKKIFEAVFRVVSGGDASVTKIGFSFFSTVFQKGVGFEQSVNTEDSLLLKIMCVLWDLKPDWRNNDGFSCWVKCVLDGTMRGVLNGYSKVYDYMPLLIDCCSPSLSSWNGSAIATLVSEFAPAIFSTETPVPVLEDVLKKLSKNLISIPPNPGCLQIVDAVMDTLCPEQFCGSAKEIFLQLAPLFSHAAADVTKTLGKFVKAFGVEKLWKCVDGTTQRTVLLPLLRDYLSNAKFKFWLENILPLSTPASKDTLKTVVWEALIGFSRDPASVNDFPAQLIGKTIVSHPSVRLPALSALRQFMQWPQSEPIVTKHQKSYLPLLFGLYVKEKVQSAEEETKHECTGHAESILLTIENYLKFCEEELVVDLLNRAVNKYETEENDKEKPPVMDLVGVLAKAHAPAEILKTLLTLASKALEDTKHQKRAYRILNALLCNDNLDDDSADEILNLLQKHQGNLKSNAEALRLECLITIIEQDESLIQKFLPEAVLNLLSVNAKTRKLANQYCRTSLEKLEDMERLRSVIKLGLEATSVFVRASTVTFMSLMLMETEQNQPDAELVQACIDQLTVPVQGLKGTANDMAVLRKECMAHISLNLSLFKSLMGPYAGAIGTILSNPGNPRKEMNKILARMIKVFGVAGLKAVMPNSSDPKMASRIKNLQKKIRKLKEDKAKKTTSRDDYYNAVTKGNKADESDSSDDEDDNVRLSKRPSGSKGLVIKEGVVDFLDTKDIAGALIAKPKAKAAEEPFKVSDEGKLIIEMEDEMKKSKLDLTNRKRKGGMSNASVREDDEDDEEIFGRSDRDDTKSVRSVRSIKSVKSSRSVGSRKLIRPKKARF